VSARLTVEVELPDTLDEGPLLTLVSIVLGALRESDVPVRRIVVEEQA
jgi:hypothetical protein